MTKISVIQMVTMTFESAAAIHAAVDDNDDVIMMLGMKLSMIMKMMIMMMSILVMNITMTIMMNFRMKILIMML